MRPTQNAPVLLFEAATFRFGVFVAEVASIKSGVAIVPVPFAHPALVGLLDAPDSEAIPVFELARSAKSAGAIEVALFDTVQGPVGIRLDAVVGARSDYDILTDAEAFQDALSALPESLALTVTTAGRSSGIPFFFFSPDAFLGRLDLARAERPLPDGEER